MFDRIFTMMAGRDEELPARPRGRIVYDPAIGGFIDEPPPARPATGYLGRGELPHAAAPAPAATPAPTRQAASTPGSQALVDEILSMARDK